MKKVLITGISGFIGEHLCKYYLKNNYKVIGVGRSEVTFKHNNFEFIQSDYKNNGLEEIFVKYKPNYFIHCASSSSVGASIKDPQDDFESSVAILYKILFALCKVKLNPKFIFLSSAAVYGNPTNIPIKENDEINPISPYGLNKKICEDICNYFIKNKGMNIKILRIFSVYGSGLKKQILWDMNRKIGANINQLELYGTGNETRDFINIKDLIQAIDLILKCETKEYVFNIGNGEEISINELAKLFLKNNNLNCNILKFNNVVKIGDPLKWKADITKLEELGYTKQVSIEDGIKSYIKWLKSIE